MIGSASPAPWPVRFWAAPLLVAWLVVPHSPRAAESTLRSPSALVTVEQAPAVAPVPEGPVTGKGDDDGGRIYHGTAVAPGNASWQAEIYREISDARWSQHLHDHADETRGKWELQHWCGGSLIAEDWVITAAHCVLVDPAVSDTFLKPEFATARAAISVSRDRKVPLSTCVAANVVVDGFRIRLGANDVSRGDGVTYRIDCAVVHPGWKPGDRFHDDIALLHFVADGPPPPRDSKRIRRILLHSDPVLAEGTPVAVLGWGKTQPVQGFAPAAQLLQASLEVQKQARCAQQLGVSADLIHEQVLCAGSAESKTCLGDSGGPVVFASGRPNYLVGIVSWGNADCSGNGKPGVYTRVASYTKWIDDVLEAPR